MTGNWALKHILLFLEIALLHWFLIKCYLEKTRYNLIQYHVGYKDQMNSVVFLKTSIKAIFLIKGVAVIWGLTTDDFSLCCKNWCLDVCVTSALDIGLVSCTLVLCGFVPYEFTHKVRSIPAEVRTAACFEGKDWYIVVELCTVLPRYCGLFYRWILRAQTQRITIYNLSTNEWILKNLKDFFCSIACAFLTFLWLRML